MTIPDEKELTDGIARCLAAAYGGPVSVSSLRRLSGGASRETWSFDADGPAGSRHALVLRRDPAGSPRPEAMAMEARLLDAARRAGVPVAAVVASGDGVDGIGTPYLVMERVDGETIPRKLLRDVRFAAARAGLARELGRILARIHAVPLADLPRLPTEDPLASLERRYADSGPALPAFEIALRWLKENRPAPVAAALVHGDFRNGNLMLNPTGVRAVLDWELAHAGDPAEDLGWLCVRAWRFGSPAPAGGFGSREELLDGYAEVAGSRPDPERVHWWEVYGTLNWGVMCRQQAQRHLSGNERSVELAALGSRVSEQEHDVLLALGLVDPKPRPDVLQSSTVAADQTRAAVGRPDWRDLLDAVRGFLETELFHADDARLRFHARVAANVLRIAERDLLLSAEQRAVRARSLGRLGCADETELAEAIRRGSMDDRWGEAVAAVADTVAEKLAVANPAYAAPHV
ncbi:phosphotransferase family protein [Streptomyces sp. NPDC052309]|uniref:phosphotransferase family protein n=1 Tax=Streptomyces sp. NPDC052309 TaxID=3155421 RepID=UPI003436646E